MWHGCGTSIWLATLRLFQNIDSMLSTYLLADSAYTERYMGLPLPEDNWEGYEMASLTK